MAHSTRRGEALVSRHFRIPVLPCKQYPYEVVTLAELDPAERAHNVFAHLVVYERQRTSGPERLYRICLQDESILRRVIEEGDEWLSALLLYVLTHELVHVVRFQRAEESFRASHSARQREEDEVHRLTLEILERAGAPRWRRLRELYGNPVIPAHLVHDGPDLS